MSAQSVARKYANALYQVAQKNGTAAIVARDLESLTASLDASPKLDAILRSRLVVPRKKHALVDALIAAAPETSPELARLLGLLAERDRLGIIRGVASEYRARTMEAGRVMSAEIVTAVPVDGAQKTRLAEALGRATGQQVVVTDRVDPSIVAGVIATVGGVVYDGSAVRQMELLRQKLVADA